MRFVVLKPVDFPASLKGSLVEHVLKITIMLSFSETVKNVHASSTQVQQQFDVTCMTSL